MGEIVSISIGSYDFISYKNTFGDLLTIYSPEDRQIKTVIDEDGDEYIQYLYVTTVERAKIALDCLGYTVKLARKSFEKSKQEEIDFREGLDFDNDRSLNEINEIKNNYLFEQWCKTVQKFSLMLSKDRYSYSTHKYKWLESQRKRKSLSFTEKMILDSLPFNDNGHFFGVYYECSSIWEIFRVILDAFDPNEEIVLDYTNLFNGGWCNEYPEDEDFCVSKTIILTEGSYDADVISRSMQLLYPFMIKNFSFIDFSGANVQGSANFLTHYVKAFIGAGIQNRVIALYDNDAAGCCEIETLKNIKLPPNFKIMHLPNISLAENYPTIGPTKDEPLNINGKACSIELFLGKDILQKDGELTPVMWKGYMDKIGVYQGEVLYKGELHKKFEKKLNKAIMHGVRNYQDWYEMDILLKSLFKTFLDN